MSAVNRHGRGWSGSHTVVDNAVGVVRAPERWNKKIEQRLPDYFRAF